MSANSWRLVSTRSCATLAFAALVGAGLALSACQEPPTGPVDRVEPPTPEDRETADEFRRKAHEAALAQALPLALAAQKLGQPLAVYRAGLGPAAIPPLTLGDRSAIAEQVDAAELALAEIDEAYLAPSSVVILRAVRFEITKLNDELERRPKLRQDPVAALQILDEVLDELDYRLIHADCDASCEGLAKSLAEALPSVRSQLAAASPAATKRARALSLELAGRSRALAALPLLADHQPLAAGLGQLAEALDEHGEWLVELDAALPNAAATHVWTAKPAPIKPGGIAAIERLPDVIGSQTLSRRLAVEERIILDGERDVAKVSSHVRRWDALQRELVKDPVPDDPAKPVDLERCTAALERITTGLAGVEGVDAPSFRCDRFVAWLADRELSEARLVLAILDDGVIEPQRRTLRHAELPEIALIEGQWSPTVHTHLRRVMLLAQLPELGARALAIAEGSRALCLAEAALWVHTELGLASAARDAVGSKCAALDEGEPLLDLVLGDPRGALAGYGLSLIGDEPARMVGFDRFYWVPLGLMQTLATPSGMHPDEFRLPSETQAEAAAPEVSVEVEELRPGRASP